MCFQGVWFMSRAATGPWEVASSIPQEIYTIPASSSVHHVTYVTVVEDDDDDEWVTFAYVAAYTGLMIGWGCAVWGSGWYYPPYYGTAVPRSTTRTRTPTAWAPGTTRTPAPTGAATRRTDRMAASGWARPTTRGPGPTRAAPRRTVRTDRAPPAQAYNPRTGTYAQTRQGSNVYGNWGTSSVQRGDNWAQTAHRENYRTGTTTSGIRTSEGGGAVIAHGPGGTGRTVGRTAGGDVYAGHDGNVYRKTEGGGWEQSNGSGGWDSVDRPAPTGERGTAGTKRPGQERRARRTERRAPALRAPEVRAADRSGNSNATAARGPRGTTAPPIAVPGRGAAGRDPGPEATAAPGRVVVAAADAGGKRRNDFSTTSPATSRGRRRWTTPQDSAGRCRSCSTR